MSISRRWMWHILTVDAGSIAFADWSWFVGHRCGVTSIMVKRWPITSCTRLRSTQIALTAALVRSRTLKATEVAPASSGRTTSSLSGG